LLRNFDIAIIGGGPAGSVTGLCLARMGWRVAILEASALEAERPGETLPPEINPVLRELGLREGFHECAPIESPGVVSLWSSDNPQETDFTFNPFGSGWHIDRRRFDLMLFHAAKRAGGCIFMDKRAEIARQGIGWEVSRRSEPTLFARFVVDATGRNGCRIDGSRERHTEDALLATVIRVSFADSHPHDLRTFIEAAPDGWWYSACLPMNDLIAMFFTDRESFRRGDAFIAEQMEHAPSIRRRMQGEIAQITATVVPVSSSCRRRITGRGWLAAGDSACSFDPLSGRGIFKPLQHGIAAAGAADGVLRGKTAALDEYEEMVRREFDSYLVQKKSFYASQTRWQNRPFWKARAGAAKVNAA